MALSKIVTSFATGVLAPGASIICTHGLQGYGLPLAPQRILPDKATAIAVTAYDDTTVTFTNNGTVDDEANFLIERFHTIIADPATTTPLVWRGLGAEILALAAASQISFGNDNVGASADTRFLSPGYSDTLADTVIHNISTTRAGQLKNMFVTHNAALGNGNNVVYTVMVNNVATALTVTLATGAVTAGSDLVDVVDVAQGDLVGLRAVKALGIGNGNIRAVVTIGFQ